MDGIVFTFRLICYLWTLKSERIHVEDLVHKYLSKEALRLKSLLAATLNVRTLRTHESLKRAYTKDTRNLNLFIPSWLGDVIEAQFNTETGKYLAVFYIRSTPMFYSVLV